jgi:hypothetical protein
MSVFEIGLILLGCLVLGRVLGCMVCRMKGCCNKPQSCRKPAQECCEQEADDCCEQEADDCCDENNGG